MDDDVKNFVDDDFYNTDWDEAIAEATNRTVYDPSTPFTSPVSSTKQRNERAATTLSGRPLGSSSCTKVCRELYEVSSQPTVTDDVQVYAHNLLLACNDNSTQSSSPEQQFQQEAGENNDSAGRNQTPTTPKSTTTAATLPSSFIRASFFFSEAKEKLKLQEDEQTMEEDQKENQKEEEVDETKD